MSPAPGTLPHSARRLARLRPAPFTLFVIAAAILGAALALARTASYGPALVGDSVSYVYAARNLLDGIKFEAPAVSGITDPKPFSNWPPLYPVALAAASLGGLFDPYEAAGPLNAAAFGLTILVAGLWMRRRIQSRFIAAWGCLALVLSLPLGWLAGSASAEPLFTLLVTLALIQTCNHLRDGEWKSLFWAAAFTAFAADVKYMGLALLVSVTALLLLQPGVSLVRKARRAAVYALIAAGPAGAWWARNLLLDGLTSPLPKDYSLPSLLLEMLDLFGGWLLSAPERSAPSAASGLAFVLLIALAAGTARTLLHGRPASAKGGDWAPLSVFGGFALVFIASHLTIMMTRNEYVLDGIEERHLAPLYVPFALAAAVALDRFSAFAQERKKLGAVRLRRTKALAGGAGRSRAALMMMAALLAWLALAATATAAEIRQANATGLRHDKDDVSDSETAAYLAENPPTGRTFTNWTTLLILRTEPPARMHRWGRQATLSAVRDWIPQARDDDRIVWFYGSYQPIPRDFGPSDLRGLSGLETVAELRDGVVFRPNPNAPSAFASIYAPLAARTPDARSAFDIHLDGRTLSYVRAKCDRDDVAAPFFLRVFPAAVADLPPKRRIHGFDDLGFSFDWHGVRSDGKCVVQRILPDYGIKAIRTGQAAPGSEPLWEEELLTATASAERSAEGGQPPR